MKLFIYCVFIWGIIALSACAAASSLVRSKEWTILPDPQGKFHFVSAKHITPYIEVRNSDVRFYFFNEFLKFAPIEFTLDNVNEIINTPFSKDLPTWIVIHGWMSTHDSPMAIDIKDGLVDAGPCNVIVVDWSSKAMDINYFNSLSATKQIGNIVGKFIEGISKQTDARIDTIHFVGHSLGAHIAGHAGQYLGGQTAVIVGLDVALPFVEFDNPDMRLDPSDAKYVQVVHTCAGTLGMYLPVGHADFYPNGGSEQSGCPSGTVGLGCNHDRSFIYFTESLWRGNPFKAYRCDSYENFVAGLCSNNPTANMGGFHIDTSAMGTYYLYTNSDYPFAMG